jgi:NAD(P)H-hydrate repair Nnr-like enzyme with NAD(P)H-hydrate dehydratase domain
VEADIFRLWRFCHLAEHLAGAGEINLALRNDDVRLQGRELIVKRVADKALSRQMVAFIRFDSPHDVVDAGEALERACMQMDAVPDVLDSLQPMPWIFQGDTTRSRWV